MITTGNASPILQKAMRSGLEHCLKRKKRFTVKENGVPQVPMLLFISNGSGGTGFMEETWRRIPEEYIAGNDNAIYRELDCPHYVHDYEYEEISKGIRNFIG